MFEKNKNRRYKIFITFTCKDMIMNTLNHIECWHNPNRPYLKPHKCLFLFSSFPNIAFPHPPAFLKKKVLRLKTWMIRLKIQPCSFIAFLLWQVNLSYMSLCCFVCNMSIIVLTFWIPWVLNEISRIKCLVCSCLINSNYSSTMVTTILIDWSYEASW